MKKEFKIEIKASFGSAFQEETARKSLTAILVAWQDFYQKIHKKNLIALSLIVNPETPKKPKNKSKKSLNDRT